MAIGVNKKGGGKLAENIDLEHLKSLLKQLKSSKDLIVDQEFNQLSNL